MPHKQYTNVIRLADHLPSDANIVARQQVVREALKAGIELPASVAPVAYAGVTVAPNGEIRTTACLIEPEYVPSMVQQLALLTAKLLAFAQERGADVGVAVAGLLILAFTDATVWPAMAMLR